MLIGLSWSSATSFVASYSFYGLLRIYLGSTFFGKAELFYGVTIDLLFTIIVSVYAASYNYLYNFS